MQICSDCAQKKGLTMEFPKEMPIPVESLVGSLIVDPDTKQSESVPDLSCAGCGLTFAEFRKSGLFGCDKCHEAFGVHIKKLLKQIHGQNTHEGKEPLELSGEVEVKKKIKRLRSKLDRYVKSEEYEKAAEIRDRLIDLERECKR